MPDTLIQQVTQESFSTSMGDTVLHEIVTTELISQGVMGPRGPAGPPGAEGGDVPTPIFPIVDLKTAASLTAGAFTHLDSVIVAVGTSGKLQQVTLSSSAPCKWEVKMRTGGVDTALDVIFTSGNTGNVPTHEWEPPHRDYASLTGNGTDSLFRVTVTNLDARNAAAVYATFFFDEVGL